MKVSQVTYNAKKQTNPTLKPSIRTNNNSPQVKAAIPNPIT